MSAPGGLDSLPVERGRLGGVRLVTVAAVLAVLIAGTAAWLLLPFNSECHRAQGAELDKMQALAAEAAPGLEVLDRYDRCGHQGDAQLVLLAPMEVRGGDVERLFTAAGWRRVGEHEYRSPDDRFYLTWGWHGETMERAKQPIEVSLQRVGYVAPDD